MFSVLSSSSHGFLSGPVLRRALRAGTVATTLIVVLLMTLFANVPPASAYWKSSGAAPAAATTGTLLAPTNVTASGTRSVSVSWTASAGALTPAGYFVTRTAGSTTTAACGSSPAVLLTTTTCTDATVPDGTYIYAVTAVFRSWTSRGAPSGPVSVVTPPSSAVTKLVLTGPSGPEPASTKASVGPFRVQLQEVLSGTVAIAAVDTDVYLTVTKGSAFFAAQCGQAAIVKVTILAGTSEVSFHYGSAEKGNTEFEVASGAMSATFKFTFNSVNSTAPTCVSAARSVLVATSTVTPNPSPALAPEPTPPLSETATPTVVLPLTESAEPAPAPAPAPAVEPAPAPVPTESTPALPPVEEPTPAEPPATVPLVTNEPELTVAPTAESAGS